MSKFSVKKLPPIRLVDLLKKRKTNLKEFINSSGIFTFATLQKKCEKMGVSAPSESNFLEAVGNVIASSPQEGVVVLDPPVLLKDTGEKVLVDEIKTDISMVNTPVTEPEKEEKPVETQVFSHKSTKKRRETSIEES
jgi:hypothetical protein